MFVSERIENPVEKKNMKKFENETEKNEKSKHI